MTKFITFEGGEGSGKTTQSHLLFEFLKSQNIPCIWTREIGGTETAEKIRDIILHKEMNVMTELLLILAARLDHIENVIKPTLSKGIIVICDRFIDSTLCYQGQHLGRDKVLTLYRETCGDFFPDLTFFIDVPVEEGLKRAYSRGGNNKFEEKDIAEHQKIRKEFLNLVEIFPKRIKKIDGFKNESEVTNNILAEF